MYFFYCVSKVLLIYFANRIALLSQHLDIQIIKMLQHTSVLRFGYGSAEAESAGSGCFGVLIKLSSLCRGFIFTLFNS